MDTYYDDEADRFYFRIGELGYSARNMHVNGEQIKRLRLR